MVDGTVASVVMAMGGMGGEDCITGSGCIGSVPDGVGVGVVIGVVMVVCGDVGNTFSCVLEPVEGRER